MNWATFDENLGKIETQIIKNYLPLLNIAKNPSALQELSELRAECVRIANS